MAIKLVVLSASKLVEREVILLEMQGTSDAADSNILFRVHANI